MRGVQHYLLQHVMDFVNLGKTSIAQADFANFMDLAKDLDITGLTCYNSSNVWNSTVQEDIPAKDTVKEFEQNVALQTINDSGNIIDKEDENEVSNHILETIYIDKSAKNSKYQCDNCEKTYNSSTALKKHKRAIHEGRVFQCHYCDKQMTQMYPLKTHVARVHGKGISSQNYIIE